MANLTPNVENLWMGTGIVKFKERGQGAERDLGELSSLQTELSVEKLDYWSKRGPTRRKVRSVVTQQAGTVTMVMNEFTAENLALHLMGEVSTESDGEKEVEIFAKTEIEGELRYIGQNEIGNQYEVFLASVSFQPGDALEWLPDEWGAITVTGEMLARDGSFGFARQMVTPEAGST
jgi:hypothetical protein